MRTYRDFKGIHEAALTPLQNLEAQIDALFDELKQKLRNPAQAQPRQDWLGDLNAWYMKNKHRFEWSLNEYAAITTFMEDLSEALTEPNHDALLDEFKERLKTIVRIYMTKTPRKPRTPVAAPPTNNPPPTDPAATAAAAPKEQPAPPVPPAAKVEPTAKEEEPEAAAPPPVNKTAAPKAEEPAEEPAESEDDRLMKLGAAIAFARDTEGDADPSEEDIQYALQQPLNIQHHSPMRDAYIQMARDYLQKKAGTDLDSAATPTKDQIEQPPQQEQPPGKGPLPTPTGNANPTRAELMAMTPNQFKDWMLENDPELVSAYEGMKWWTKSMRDELVGSYITNRDFLSKKTESLQYKVNKYKELLRRENRPERLLSEAARLPFNERVNFYKKKLSCRDTSSTI